MPMRHLPADGTEQIRCENKREEGTFRRNGVPRSPFSCKPLIVVSCVLQVSVLDQWWWMSEAEAQPRHSSYVSFHLVHAGTIAVHSCTVEIDGWSRPSAKPPNSSKAKYCILWPIFQVLSWLCPVYFIPLLNSFLFISDFICVICLERCFYAAELRQEFCTVPSDQGERASQTKGEDIFFPNRTHQHINQILLPPLALRHCGSEWSKKKARLQQRAYCRLIRAFWAEGPLLPPPWEAPNSTACGVNGGPSWELWQTC